ncbi:MAG: MBL fold metallo-hydrolase [Flavobacterium sp.]|nr:MAG: MBL fold metallo-hydrolase [Flavobacterium sp.]
MEEDNNYGLQNTHELTITFFDVAGGDAIWIRFLGNDLVWHNILIDGGYGYHYRDIMGPLIRQITKHETIDLWIITHTDLDHIGAVTGFIQDLQIKDKKSAVREFWFNHSGVSMSGGNGKLGVRQAIQLREYLEDNGLLVKQAITNILPTVDLYGLDIEFLSPSEITLDKANELWRSKEPSGKLGRTSEQSDHKKTIEQLTSCGFSEDTDTWNGASIAFSITFKEIKGIILADSHPNVVIEALEAAVDKHQLPREVEFLQLSHHGSRANNNPELFELIKTQSYVVTGNGITNQHPDKETLVRILNQKDRIDNYINFIFPCDTEPLRELFKVDGNPFSIQKFDCIFPEAGENFACLRYLPIKKA